jgi:adenylate cyclase
LAEQEVEHRLMAIVSGDVAGYSRLIASDEATAVRLVTIYREEVELLVQQHGGRLIDFTGDNFLAAFSSAQSSVRCAVQIQNVIKARNAGLPKDERMEFRLGIHQGEVRVQEARIFGTGVNIAARLESLADVGGICISASVHEQILGRLDFEYEDMGEQLVKNIPNPVKVYRVRFTPGAPSVSAPEQPRRTALIAAVAAAALLVMTMAGAWLLTDGPKSVTASAPGSVTVAGLAPASRLQGSIEVAPGTFPPLPDKPSVVVLPFSNMSEQADQQYFADGITEDLTTELSRIPQLFVIARNSAFTYKGRAVDIGQVGRELGVRYVLEGSVRRAGGRVRITAQLIDASSGFHVWSERYDRDMADIFGVQSEIAEKIMAALQIEISEAEMARVQRVPVDNLTAYDAWLRARALLLQHRREGVEEARELLEYAIELEPSYAEAYADLGNTYMAELGGWNFDRSLIDRAEELGRRALDLDPLSPEGYITLAAVKMAQGRADEALPLAEKAVELAPSRFDARSVLGMTQVQVGDLERGRQTLEEAIRYNPREIGMTSTFLGMAHYMDGEFDEAVELWERVRAANPDALADRISLISHYQVMGESEKAREIVAEVRAVNPDYTAAMALQFLELRGGFSEDTGEMMVEALRMAGL